MPQRVHRRFDRRSRGLSAVSVQRGAGNFARRRHGDAHGLLAHGFALGLEARHDCRRCVRQALQMRCALTLGRDERVVLALLVRALLLCLDFLGRKTLGRFFHDRAVGRELGVEGVFADVAH